WESYNDIQDSNKVLLSESIDRILLDAALTPVHLVAEDDTGGNESDPEILMAASFHQVFSNYERIGGIGFGLNRASENDFSGLGAGQTGTKSALAVRPGQLKICRSDASKAKFLTRHVKDALANKHNVIIDCCEQQQIHAINEELSEAGVHPFQVTSENWLPDYLAQALRQPVCLVVPFSVANIPYWPRTISERTKLNLLVISLGVSESWREHLRRLHDLRTRAQVKQIWTVAGIRDNSIVNGKPGQWLMLMLPGFLRSKFYSILLAHKQKETDRHRLRSNHSLLRYERELQDLLAFSG
nr:hypothetical protein [Granulosicoccus sp.]